MYQNKTLEDWILECSRLRKENAHLKQQIAGLLHQKKAEKNSLESPEVVTKHSPLPVKIQLFNSLFKGRADVYATRWEAKDGRAGYLPACAHEWDRPICQKPKIKCSECQHRMLLPLTDQVIEGHLYGQHIVGLYPMQKDESCSFLAVDFDKENWQKDVLAFIQICKAYGIPYSLERSRSGNGGHVWFFFSEKMNDSD